MQNTVAGEKMEIRAMLPAVKALLVVAIAISSSLLFAARLTGADVSALPPDAELKKWIVGNWRAELPAVDSAAHYVYEAFAGDGTFRHFEAVKEGSAAEKLMGKMTGTWNVEGGFLVTRVTTSNMSRAVGHIARDRIESASHESFVLREEGSSHMRRRTQLPADLVSGRREVAKIFTLEEAAQVLRYAVKPQYSREAQRMRATGTGVFELRFDYESGRLEAIDIVQSTGSRLLDHDAINGLKEWKAKPHSVHVMRIPIKFTFSGR